MGAGIALPTDATSAQIRDAIERVLAEPAYAESAHRFAAEYDPTALLAIDELESLGKS